MADYLGYFICYSILNLAYFFYYLIEYAPDTDDFESLKEFVLEITYIRLFFTIICLPGFITAWTFAFIVNVLPDSEIFKKIVNKKIFRK